MADTGPRLVLALSDRYRIGEQIGRGGMATVYAAHDLKHNRSVAIKVLRPELAAALGTERFLREIQVAARLRHPHIIPLFDSGQIPATGDSPPVLFYIMPRIEGESLRNLINREGALPIPLALRIAGQVADALDHAHKAGVVHRDIKPENILLEAGHALVADFGISRAVKVLREEEPATANLTETGSTVGTPAYMSPEQIEGRPDIDGKSDVYSLACVLYEMLSGRAPFTAPTPTAVAARHLIDPVPSIRQARPDVSAAIEQALLRGMAKSPDNRFDTAGDFNAAIREGESSPMAALPRRRSRLAVGALLLLLATAGASVLLRLNRSATPAVNTSTLAILPFSVQGPDTLQLGEGMVTLLGSKMDGAGDLRTVDGRALLSYLAMEKPGTLDPARARRIAQHFSAGMFVLGEVVALGPRLQITARLYHQDEDASPTSASEEGDLSTVFEMVDRLAARLLAGRAGGAGNLDQVAGLSTTSLPAFRSFLNGESAMRTGKFDEARAAYVHATEADSTFALAWYRLSVVAQWLGQQDLVQAAARHAQQRSALLPERVRRLLEANIASSNGDLVTAERIYRGITGNYPDDVEAWMQLAELLFHNGPAAGRDSRESRGPWHRVLEYEPYNLIPLIHLARLAAFDRDTAELDSLVNRVRLVRAQAGQTTAAARAEELELAMLETVVHQDSVGMERVLADLAQATSLNLAITLWDVAAFTYDFDAARRIADLLADPSRETGERAVAYGLKGLMSLGQGRWRQALAEFDSADQLTPGLGTSYRAYFLASPFRPVPDDLTEIRQSLATIRRPSTPPPPASSVFFQVHYDIANHARIYLQGLYAAMAGDFGSASRSANEVETLPGNEDQRKLSRIFGGGIRAEIALRQGDSAQALRHLLRAREDVSYLLRNTPFYTGMRERYRRGELLERSGSNEEALLWYSTLESQGPADPAYLAPSFLARGRVSEQLNRPDSAAGYYRRMLQLWENADPEFLPLIEEARAGLNRVSGQR